MRTFSSAIFVLMCLLYIHCSAQRSTVEASSKRTAKSYAAALEHRNSGEIDKAISGLAAIVKSDPTFIDAPLTLAALYYEQSKVSEAAKAFEHAIAIDSFHTPRALYSLGRIYIQTGEFSKARKLLQRYLAHGNAEGTTKTNAESYLTKAIAAEQIMVHPVSFEPEILKGSINTENAEALPAFTIDGQYLLFTRKSNGQEDLYIAQWDSLEAMWVDPEYMRGVNTSKNEGAHAVSADGSMIAFTACGRTDGVGSCDIYFWQRKNGVWQSPVNAGGLNSTGWDGHPALSSDGNAMYFSSDRSSNVGGRDIWYTERHGERWTKPINLGSTINTSGNEESPFLFFDNRTLYFMSDGHPGLGDFDLFFSEKIGEKWSTPKNLGYPINTIGREGALAIHPDREYAYYTSDREQGQHDIYRFKLDSTLLPTPVSNLQGIVTDISNSNPVIGEVVIYDLKDSTEHYRYTTDADGKYSSVIVHGRTYGIHVVAQGYAFWSGQLHVETSEPYGQKVVNVALTPLDQPAAQSESPIVLRNIEFATGSATLLTSSLQELNQLHALLVENPDVQIEIRGHTDDVGSEENNQLLSESRARAVYDWLIEQSLSADRLSYKGFGESTPIATNDTAEGRQENRRTEFVLKN